MTASVVWITGLSAAGKTTIASALVGELRARGDAALLLDGDAVRRAIQAQDAGHDRGGRLRNAYRIARLACLIAQQDIIAVVATMSLFHEIHAWNRANFPRYLEVLLDVSAEVLRQRDPKGLYADLFSGKEENVAGFDLAVEIPRAPDMIIANNDGEAEIRPIVQRILLRLDRMHGGC
jgi:adenylylsulfate kinase